MPTPITVKARLRAISFINGKRYRPGQVIDVELENGRLPLWAEKCDQTDMAIINGGISPRDAERIAQEKRRVAEVERAQAQLALERAKREEAEAEEAERVANDAIKRADTLSAQAKETKKPKA